MWVDGSRCLKRGWKYVFWRCMSACEWRPEGGCEQLHNSMNSNLWEGKERDSSAGDRGHQGGWKRMGVCNMWVLSGAGRLVMDDKEVGDGKEKVLLRAISHLDEESGDEGFCSASAAGQQNWCKTVSFLQEKTNRSRSVFSSLSRKLKRECLSQGCYKGIVTPSDAEKKNLIITGMFCTPRWWGAGEKGADNSISLPYLSCCWCQAVENGAKAPK